MCVVVKATEYNGYANRDIWEKDGSVGAAVKERGVVQGPGSPNPGEPLGDRGSDSGNGGRYDHERRLREVENAVVRIDTELKHIATKEDVLKVRLWVVSGMAGGVVTAIMLLLGFLRVFLPESIQP